MDKKRLVLIGGGHAHLTILAGLRGMMEQGVSVTVIQPSTHHYYSGMGAGMLGMTYTPEEIRFHTRQAVEKGGGALVLGRARRVDPDARTVVLEDGEEIPYDVLSCNVGSGVPQDRTDAAGSDVFPVKPIEGLLTAQRRFLDLSRARPLNVGVVGGGPSAIEMAGNIWQLGRRDGVHPPTVRIVAGRRLMRGKPDKVRKLALRSFRQRSVQVLEGPYVREVKEGRMLLDDGRVLPCDMAFLAVGVKPSTLFADSGLPVAADGGLKVNRYLQCIGYPDIFGGGDCINFEPQPLDKVGVYAVRQNPVLAHNVAAKLLGGVLLPFAPGGAYLLIYNLGGGQGIFCKWSVAFDGRLAFHIKDYIDRRFMRRFQAMEHS